MDHLKQTIKIGSPGSGWKYRARMLVNSPRLLVCMRMGYRGDKSIKHCLRILRRISRFLCPRLRRDGPLVPSMEWMVCELGGRAFAAFMRPSKKWQEGETARFIIDPEAVLDAAPHATARDIEVMAVHEVFHAAEHALGLRPSERRVRRAAELWARKGKIQWPLRQKDGG